MKAGEAQAIFRGLPMGLLDEIVPGTAMILAPHADDESLGCGGLIAASCAAGRPPLVVIVTDGAGSHPGSPTWTAARLRARREAEAEAATCHLGLPPARLAFLRLPDTRSPHAGAGFETAVETLSSLAGEHGCDTILAPWSHDPHCDHESVWKMGLALSRREQMRLLAYPVWGWLLAPEIELDTGVLTGWRFDVTPFQSRKALAIQAHESQYGELIADDPNGFRLPNELLEVFASPYEVFLGP
ncbi:PIG-L deacetylase family protein [Lichenicola cladoniae]|nr:PIG-L family deacetylase [Lichenicola cladoniae]